jgi:hypothetical protein
MFAATTRVSDICVGGMYCVHLVEFWYHIIDDIITGDNVIMEDDIT